MKSNKWLIGLLAIVLPCGGYFGFKQIAVPPIDEEALTTASIDFVKTTYSDAAKKTSHPLVAEDAISLQKYIKVRQAWLAQRMPEDLVCKSFTVDTQDVQRQYFKKSVIVTLTTSEEYTSESSASDNYGVGCGYRLYMEPRGNTWKITKAIADDTAGCHFFPQFFNQPTVFNDYDFKWFEENIKNLI